MASDSDSEFGHAAPGAQASSNALYLRLALTAGGNLLALLILAVAWYCWQILSAYRAALLWSVLSSIALRDLRDVLVEDATRRLEHTRSLPRILWQLACLPFASVSDACQDVAWLWAKWRQSVQDYMKVYRLQARKRLVRFSPSKQQPESQPQSQPSTDEAADEIEGAAAVPAGETAPATPLSQPQPADGDIGVAGTVYGTAHMVAKCVALGVKTLQSSSFRRHRTQRRRPVECDTVPSNVLFRWLFRACISFQAFLWLRSSFAGAMQALLLLATLAATFLAAPALVAYCARRVLSVGPAANGRAAVADGVSTPRKAQQLSKTDGWRSAIGWPLDRLAAADAWACDQLRANIRPLTSAGLIVTTLLGAVLLVAFFTVQIGQESRESLSALREALPRTWATDGDNADGWEADGPAFWPAAPVRRALLQHRPQVAQAAGQAIPWLEAKLASLLQQYNLSQVVDELRWLQSDLAEPRRCTAEEMRAALIALARARTTYRQHAGQHTAQKDKVAELEQALEAAAGVLDQRLQSAGSYRPGSDTCAAHADVCDTQAEAADAALAAAEATLVRLDARMAAEKQALQAATDARDAAQRELKQAEKRHRRCSNPGQQARQSGIAAAHSSAGPRRQLQVAYQSFGQLRVRDGISSLQALGVQFLTAARNSLSGSSAGASQELQQLAQAAAEPLLSLGKVVGSSVLNSSSLALTGGIGILRLCLGIVNFGVQAMLFIFLLYALLAAKTDPLTYTIRVLPLSDYAREKTAAAFSDALKSVFVSTIKLAAFHALFTWLTFRMFGIHLIYLSVLASAIAACLPLVPVCLVAVPAALQLLAQGRGVSAIVLLTLHVLAYYVGDAIIMAEVPGSHRFPTLTALGVLGGISAFDNAIQGALLGPILLSCIAVFFDLHVRLIAGLPANVSSSASLHSFGRSRSVSVDSL